MPFKREPGLTKAHFRIARLIARWEENGRPAFAADLWKALNLAAESSLTPTLRIMERNGYIKVHGGGAKGRSRLVKLTPKARLALGLGGLPLLGSIPAGSLNEALAETATIIEDDGLLPRRPGDFLLRVEGDSMIGDGILDGDLVLLRPEANVRQGEIAAVRVGDYHDSTLKRVLAERGQIRLCASNPKYRDIVVPEEQWHGVAGVFRGLIRHVRSHR